MIIDYEHELTSAGGQLFNASPEYGSKPYDQGVTSPGDPAVGEPLEFWIQVDDANSDVATYYDVDLVCSSTGASGGSEEVVVTRRLLTAALLAGTSHMIGRVPPHLCTRRYLAAKLTPDSGTPTTGKIKAWLQKSSDGTPANAGYPTA